MIFNWLSSKYQIEEFKIAGDFWLQKTLSPINFEDPYLGYRKRFFREDEEIVSEEMGFLEGISGIGLSLMASIGINDDWKKLLLVGIS